MTNSLSTLIDRYKERRPAQLDAMTASTDDEFDAALSSLLAEAIRGLEANSKNFRDLDENALTAVLALALNRPGLTVTQETNSNGHVDITFTGDQCEPMQKRLGEAKIWSGYKYHIAGLEQLLKYMTGREPSGLMLNYCRLRDIEGLTKSLRSDMDAHLPLRQGGPCHDHTLHWSFCSRHAHQSGRDVTISHIGCNLYVMG